MLLRKTGVRNQLPAFQPEISFQGEALDWGMKIASISVVLLAMASPCTIRDYPIVLLFCPLVEGERLYRVEMDERSERGE